MKSIKTIIALLLTAAMIFTFAACESATPGTEPSKADESQKQADAGIVKDGKMTYTLSADVAAIHGKYSQEQHAGADTYTFSHGAAGFDVNFTGTDFYVYIPEVPMDGDNVRQVGMSVLIDSEMPMDATMVFPKEAGWMQVASGLADGEHHIRIRKQSRGFYGIMASDWFCVSEIATNESGKVNAPDKLSDLVIEVYGDSISNGDAVWYNEDGSNSAYTNGNWTGVLERLLDAEVKVTANTGNGLLGWVMATKNGNADNLLPPQNNWDKIDPNHGDKPYSHEGANQADVVIINLGTNDRGDYHNGDITLKSFSEEYVRFIKQIRTDCPDAIVITTIGAMGGVDEWGEMLGGKGFDYVEYEWMDGEYKRTIAEGSMIENLLGAGITVTGTAFDSGVEQYEGQSASQVIDSNVSTGWQPKNKGDVGENCYVGVRFDTATEAHGLTVTWEENTRAKASADGYRVEITTDGKKWSKPSNIKYSYGGAVDTVTFKSTDIKGIRVVVLAASSDKYAPKIFELAVASDAKAAAVISEDDIIHQKSVVDQCNEWAGETFCYFVEIQKCDTIGTNETVNTLKDGKPTDIPAGAGYDFGHPSNLAGEIYGLQYATLINKALNLGRELPTDIPAYTFEKRTGRTAPEGNLIEYLTG